MSGCEICASQGVLDLLTSVEIDDLLSLVVDWVCVSMVRVGLQNLSANFKQRKWCRKDSRVMWFAKSESAWIWLTKGCPPIWAGQAIPIFDKECTIFSVKRQIQRIWASERLYLPPSLWFSPAWILRVESSHLQKTKHCLSHSHERSEHGFPAFLHRPMMLHWYWVSLEVRQIRNGNSRKKNDPWNSHKSHCRKRLVDRSAILSTRSAKCAHACAGSST